MRLVVNRIRRDRGGGTWRVIHGRPTLDALLADFPSGRIVRLFGTGTAMTVTGNRSISMPDGRDFKVAGGGSGVVVGPAVRDTVDAIGMGREADTEGRHPRVMLVDEARATVAQEAIGAHKGTVRADSAAEAESPSVFHIFPSHPFPEHAGLPLHGAHRRCCPSAGRRRLGKSVKAC